MDRGALPAGHDRSPHRQRAEPDRRSSTTRTCCGRYASVFPALHLKAFTAVEIHYFAAKFGMSYREVLERLIEAGLGSLPGGGAEVFAQRVRQRICRDKVDAEGWLDVHRTAHQLGLKSNCTILYGTIETREERIDHLLRLRDLQDENGRVPGLRAAGLSPRGQPPAEARRANGRRRSANDRRQPPDAGQHPAHQGLLGDARPEDGPGRERLAAPTTWTAP